MAGTRKTTQSDEAQDEDDAPKGSAPATSSAPSQSENEPRPWRVETYSQGEQWGWRLAAANGTVIRDVPASFDDRATAIGDAEDADLPEGTIIADRQVTQPRGW